LHSPSFFLTTFPFVLQVTISNAHWLKYVIPSVPHTGFLTGGHLLLQTKVCKVNVKQVECFT